MHPTRARIISIFSLISNPAEQLKVSQVEDHNIYWRQWGIFLLIALKNSGKNNGFKSSSALGINNLYSSFRLSISILFAKILGNGAHTWLSSVTELRVLFLLNLEYPLARCTELCLRKYFQPVASAAPISNRRPHFQLLFTNFVNTEETAVIPNVNIIANNFAKFFFSWHVLFFVQYWHGACTECSIFLPIFLIFNESVLYSRY